MLVIAQRFPFGRFHATRWNQSPFEDPYGEWPPSPLRLLRALTARWFQYNRETGNSDEELRDELLRMLSSAIPSYRLPGYTWRGQAIRQYHPTGLGEQYKYIKEANTNKKILDYSYKQVGKTLSHDHYRALSPSEPILWIWDSVILLKSLLNLLTELLRRVLYFGRAESFCHFEIAEATNAEANCLLSARMGEGPPVLVPMPDLDLKILMAATDDKLIARRRIPPGTAWYYAAIPNPPSRHTRLSHRQTLPKNQKIVQFVVGGRVFPPISEWVKVAERFRGKVLKICAQLLIGDKTAAYRDLPDTYRDKLSLLTGKDGRGDPLRKHEHAYFGLWPDEHGLPTRLLCWRSTPFTDDEIKALLTASKYLYPWEYGTTDWKLKMVPLPFEAPPPSGFFAESDTWISVTPFVLPANRRRFRSNGRERSGEKPEKLMEKLLHKCGYPVPKAIELLDCPKQVEWVSVHLTQKERTQRPGGQTNNRLPGYRMRISFALPIKGPLALGHSAHFGLGLFTGLGQCT